MTIPFVACLVFLGFWAAVMISSFGNVRSRMDASLTLRANRNRVLIFLALVIALVFPFWFSRTLNGANLILVAIPVALGFIAACTLEWLNGKRRMRSMEEIKGSLMVTSLIAATAPLLFMATFVTYIVAFMLPTLGSWYAVLAIAIVAGVLSIPAIDLTLDELGTVRNVNETLEKRYQIRFANTLPFAAAILWTAMLTALIRITA